MGFTAFFKLFGVQSKAAIGHGLWFVTTIIVMYLLLPMLEKLFKHPHGLWNLIGVIVLSIVLDLTMWGTENIYPVVISFSLGAYVVFSGRLDRVLRRGLISSSILGAILLVIAGLSASGVFPLAIQKVILAPLYPLAFVPLLFAVVRKLPTPILTASSFFAGLSYEFYILHFYFINDELKSFVPYNMGLAAHITTAFFITLFLSYVLSRVAVPLRQLTESYFVQSHKDSSLT
jgi:peptidoglycan/LPS O-acetylase OafA/YrhL